MWFQQILVVSKSDLQTILEESNHMWFLQTQVLSYKIQTIRSFLTLVVQGDITTSGSVVATI